MLTGKVAPDKGRDSGNTMFHKKFPGGHLTIGGANSPAGLASRPIRYLLGDEIDRWEVTKEGSALNLARKRTARFWNRKILLVSSPTFENRGIEAEYQGTQQHQWQVPCLHCGEHQFPALKHFSWQKNDAGDPINIHYACEHCGADHPIEDQHRIKLGGRWVQINNGNPRRKGYHLNQWGSPLAEWQETIEEFLAAKNDPEKLQAVVNTAFAECWTGGGDGVDENALLQRREPYAAPVPADVLVLTAGVDTQDDRLEVEIVGWGDGEESWGIEHRVIHGDPAGPEIWAELDAVLSQEFEHESGARMGITSTCIDSGGHHTKMVYDYCRTRWARRIYAIKGVGGEGRPIVSAPKKQKGVTPGPPVKLFSLGVDQAKGLLYARLSITEPGPSYCHFPQHYSEEWFRQLTAEQVITKHRKGFAYREWVKTRPRNEALDLRVYALAALKILNPVWSRLGQAETQQSTQPKRQPRPRPQGGGWFG
ncbi:MAG: phage terminase large subunit family protein, partial [Synechococcus sp.]